MSLVRADVEAMIARREPLRLNGRDLSGADLSRLDLSGAE